MQNTRSSETTFGFFTEKNQTKQETKDDTKTKAQIWNDTARHIAEKTLGNPVAWSIGKLGYVFAYGTDYAKAAYNKMTESCCKKNDVNRKKPY